ncbi:MAG: uracil-DNA glycosylase family protein [Pseudomonas sp.]|uniref:uracil-DNA glycosylase family protein n=1 Tax=Pseudomonas sp. TaxID=306 RepID=UPI00339B8B5D
MALDANYQQAFRELAAQTEGIDRAVYQRFARDPLEPIIGLGDPDARLGFFGRDPGRDEVKYGEPFIGSAGQLLRKVLYQHLCGQALPDFEASRALSPQFFWCNTVPYKPIGNQPWSMAVKRRFHPLMRDLLIDAWHGHELITLGREAFFWFGIGQPLLIRQRLAAFWHAETRFSASFEVRLQAASGAARTLRLHPLPHPSPLNQAWLEHFAPLLEARLRALEL